MASNKILCLKGHNSCSETDEKPAHLSSFLVVKLSGEKVAHHIIGHLRRFVSALTQPSLIANITNGSQILVLITPDVVSQGQVPCSFIAIVD